MKLSQIHAKLKAYKRPTRRVTLTDWRESSGILEVEINIILAVVGMILKGKSISDQDSARFKLAGVRVRNMLVSLRLT